MCGERPGALTATGQGLPTPCFTGGGNALGSGPLSTVCLMISSLSLKCLSDHGWASLDKPWYSHLGSGGVTLVLQGALSGRRTGQMLAGVST